MITVLGKRVHKIEQVREVLPEHPEYVDIETPSGLPLMYVGSLADMPYERWLFARQGKVAIRVRRHADDTIEVEG